MRVGVFSRFLVSVAWGGFVMAASAHDPHDCPPGMVDLPGMKQAHVEQADLLADPLVTLNDLFNVGAGLGEFRWTQCDGMGRPATTGDGQKRAPDQPLMARASGPEANSCFGCHAQPRSGGSGDFVANTFNGAETFDEVVESISPEIANERNTTGMFGAGYVELLAREMTADLQAQRDEYAAQSYTGTVKLKTKGVSFKVTFENGVVSDARGIDTDLIVKPFGAGGTKVSIRQFTVEAFNRHHGMQAEEAYDLYYGDPDFDEDGVTRELTIGDISAATLWQSMLDRPLQQIETDDPEDLEQIDRGKQLLVDVGCTSCHKEKLTLNNRLFCDPGPYNPPHIFQDQSQQFCVTLDYYVDDQTKQDDTQSDAPPADTPLDIFAYTDLKRHHMCDDPDDVADPIRLLCNEQHAEGRPDQGPYPGAEYFLTAELWSLGESWPYGHDGRYPSLGPIILAHAGEARAARDAYAGLPEEDQIAIIKYLKTLKILDQPVRLFDG